MASSVVSHEHQDSGGIIQPPRAMWQNDSRLVIAICVGHSMKGSTRGLSFRKQTRIGAPPLHRFNPLRDGIPVQWEQRREGIGKLQKNQLRLLSVQVRAQEYDPIVSSVRRQYRWIHRLPWEKKRVRKTTRSLWSLQLIRCVTIRPPTYNPHALASGLDRWAVESVWHGCDQPSNQWHKNSMLIVTVEHIKSSHKVHCP